MNLTTTIPYEDYAKLVKDSADKASVIALLNTKFPDDTCQLIAIKALLGIEEETEEPSIPDVPETPDDTEPTEPPTTGDEGNTEP